MSKLSKNGQIDRCCYVGRFMGTSIDAKGVIMYDTPFNEGLLIYFNFDELNPLDMLYPKCTVEFKVFTPHNGRPIACRVSVRYNNNGYATHNSDYRIQAERRSLQLIGDAQLEEARRKEERTRAKRDEDEMTVQLEGARQREKDKAQRRQREQDEAQRARQTDDGAQRRQTEQDEAQRDEARKQEMKKQTLYCSTCSLPTISSLANFCRGCGSEH